MGIKAEHFTKFQDKKDFFFWPYYSNLRAKYSMSFFFMIPCILYISQVNYKFFIQITKNDIFNNNNTGCAALPEKTVKKHRYQTIFWRFYRKSQNSTLVT